MFKEASAQVVVEYQCDECKRDIVYVAQRVDLDDLNAFKRELIMTMNVEGHKVNGKWYCADCSVGL